MQNSKFVGACLLISSLILSVAIVYHAIASTPTSSDIGRYQFQASNPPGVLWVIDTTTGETKGRSG